MFDIKEQLNMYESLRYDGCEAAMTKERAFSFYIPVSLKYFKTLAEGGQPEETDPKMLAEIKRSFYGICERLKDSELPKDFLNDSEKVALFYHKRGKMLGIPTDFIADDMTGEDILKGWFDAYWRKVEPLLKNPALGEYMYASHAKDSEMFWCFLVGSASYLAIETAYRWGFDPVGIYREAALDDPLSLWTYRDEAYLYQKWRDNEFMGEIRGAKDILALGAGGMPEIRRTGYLRNDSAWEDQTFCACDLDPRIDFDFLMEDQPLPAHERIRYEHTDIETMLRNMREEGNTFDLIYVKGVLSFMMDKIGPLSLAAMSLLRPGGKFIFDLQLEHFAMLRDACIFGWGGGASSAKIELLPREKALGKVYAQTDAVGIKRTQILDPVVMTDPFNRDEFGMNIIIKKP